MSPIPIIIFNYKTMKINVCLALQIILLPFVEAFQPSFVRVTVCRSFGHYSIIRMKSEDGSPNANEPKKNTLFQRTLDDFIGKRYGAGEAFYGKRQSRLSEEEYAKTKSGKKRVYDPDGPMRDEAILLVGGLEDINQWVAFELNEKGFNVRVACSDLKQATSIFGFPGFNVDVVELKGLLTSEEKYAKSINGVQAIVIAVNFSPGLDRKKYEEELATAKSIIDISVKAKNAKVGEVKKIVLVSRLLPEVLKGRPDLITSVLQKRVDSDLYKNLQEYHDELERYLRASRFDYAIVRAPAVVSDVRVPAQYPLTLLAGSSSVALNGKRASNAVGFPFSLFSDSIDCPTVGVLDLAEVVTQSLLQDIDGITVSVFETDSTSSLALSSISKQEIIAGQRQLESSRVARKTYYGILDMDDADLRASYMIRPAEQYQSQLIEDEKLEKFWLQRLTLLEKDFDR